MIKTLAGQVKEFKKDSIITPIFMILEVIMEIFIIFILLVYGWLWQQA